MFEALKRLGIAYDSYDHPAVFTGEDAEQHWKGHQRDAGQEPVPEE